MEDIKLSNELIEGIYS